MPDDMLAASDEMLRQAAIAATESVPAPAGFLVNPGHAQANLVWDLSRDVPVTGFEVAWRTSGESEWRTCTIPSADRWQVSGLEDGREYVFRVRTACGPRFSAWTEEQDCVPGAVLSSSVGDGFAGLPLRSLFKLIGGSLWSVLRARFARS